MTVEILYPSTREEWLDLRRPNITASIAGSLLGVHPYTTSYKVWAEKTGRVEIDDADSAALRRGRYLERVIFDVLRDEHPDWEVEYPLGNRFFLDRGARLGATPDSFAARPDIAGRGTVQGKTVHESEFKNWLDPDTGDIVLPLWIAVQTIVEADLAACSWAAAAIMVVGRGLDLHLVDVPVHAGVRRRVRQAVADFWALVDSGGELPVDWQRDGQTVLDVYGRSSPERIDLSADPELEPLVEQYLDARNTMRTAKKQADQIAPRLIAALGNAEEGQTANWIVRAPSVHRDGFTVAPTTYRRLSAVQRRDNVHASF